MGESFINVVAKVINKFPWKAVGESLLVVAVDILSISIWTAYFALTAFLKLTLMILVLSLHSEMSCYNFNIH